MSKSKSYERMWDDFAKIKARGYHTKKFLPNTRIGLTNYLRELFIMKYGLWKKDSVVADIGCASGKQVFEIAKKVKFCYGTDISKEFISFAKKKQKEDKIKNVEFLQDDIEKMSFSSNKFDVVLCSEVIEHVLNLPKAVEELVRITKKGGFLLITVPNLNGDGTLWGRFLRFLRIRKFKPMTKFSLKEIYKHKDSHVREFSVESLSKLLLKYDLEIIKSTTVSAIDFSDIIIRGFLMLKFIRKLIIRYETYLSKKRVSYGRQIIMLCKKIK